MPLSQLKDADIENYMNTGDDFTTSAMQSWQTSKDELGAKKESNGKTTVTLKDDQYTVTVPVKFEKANANFVYVFESTGNTGFHVCRCTVWSGQNSPESRT